MSNKGDKNAARHEDQAAQIPNAVSVGQEAQTPFERWAGTTRAEWLGLTATIAALVVALTICLNH